MVKVSGCCLNGKFNDRAGFKEVISCLNSSQWLHAMGGVLFMAGLDGSTLHLNIIPAIIEGQRSYHYDIPLIESIKEVIIGSVDANGVYRLLVKLESMEKTEELRNAYRIAYQSLAHYLILQGLRGEAEIDIVTELAIKELGLFDFEPKSLHDIAVAKVAG